MKFQHQKDSGGTNGTKRELVQYMGTVFLSKKDRKKCTSCEMNFLRGIKITRSQTEQLTKT